MKSTLLGIAAASVLALPAIAADMPIAAPVTKAPVMVPAAFSWTGVYVGGHAGGAQGSVDWTHTNTGGIVERFNQRDSDFVYGAHAGFFYQTGMWVFGAEGTYTHLDLAQTSAALNSVDRSNAFAMKHMATAVGRVGAAWDRFLIYVQGGYATARTDFTRFVTSTGATTASSSGWDPGWTVGVGGSYAVFNNVLLGVEYNFARINIDNRTQTLAAGFAGIDTVTSANANIHQITGRISFKFP